jgi:TPP-dependent indolepyruvate ferredoxin oxidoreductase alpha subunit
MLARPNSSETAERATQIHVIPCDEYTPASGAKRIDSAAVFGRQAVPDIYREEPQLIVVAPIEIRQKCIRRPKRIPVPRRHGEKRPSRLVSFLA